MSEFAKGYESKVKRTYSELEIEGKEDLDTWGNAIYNERLINVYTDPEFINDIFTNPIVTNRPNKDSVLELVDFGSAEGYVAHTVTAQLKEKGYQVHPVGIEMNDSSLNLMKEKYPEVEGIKADLLSLPLRDNSVDTGILRFTLPYFSRESQTLVLQQIYTALKGGGFITISHDGAYDEELGRLYNDFFAEASAATGGWTVEETKANRHFPSFESLQEIAKKEGFKVISSTDLTDVAIGYLSPEAYASRFKMTDEQFANLKRVFESWKEKNLLPFEEGSLRVRRPMYSCVLRKE